MTGSAELTAASVWVFDIMQKYVHVHDFGYLIKILLLAYLLSIVEIVCNKYM